MPALVDIAGQVFGRLTVLRRVPADSKQARWLCRCDCGVELVVQGYHLRSGHSKSCGCLKREAMTTHGHTYLPEYQPWKAMVARCTDPNCYRWPRYGGKGIEVRFRDFDHFFSEIGPRPSPEHTIDRFPDNKGHYEPGNVRWATAKEQNRNKGSNRLLTHNGRTQCQAAWAEELGLSQKVICSRLLAGWSVERALTQPIRYVSRRSVDHH